MALQFVVKCLWERLERIRHRRDAFAMVINSSSQLPQGKATQCGCGAFSWPMRIQTTLYKLQTTDRL